MQVLEHVKTINVRDEKVWVVGDLHGNVNWIQTLFPAMRRFDPTLRTVLQLGDYGFEHTDRGKHAVDYWAKNAGIERVLVTLGNHEAWDRIAPAQRTAPGHAIRISDVVWLLPRPFRFRIAGREILSLGGASSVDKAYRRPGRDWFADELITETMEARAIAAGPADVLLTHESPAQAVPQVREILENNPHSFPPEALSESAEQRERVQRVSDAVAPIVHLHGHMHVHGDAQSSTGPRVICLDRDTSAGNAVVLDLRSWSFRPLPLGFGDPW